MVPRIVMNITHMARINYTALSINNLFFFRNINPCSNSLKENINPSMIREYIAIKGHR